MSLNNKEITIKKDYANYPDEKNGKGLDFKAFFEFSPDPLAIYDIKGTIVDINKEALKVSGYEKPELLNNNIFKINMFIKKDIPKAANLLARLLVGADTQPEEFNIVTKSGDIITLEAKVRLVTGKTGKYILCIFHDITSKKMMAAELKDKEERYRKMFDNSPESIVLLDKKGNFLDMNKSFTDTLGYSREEVLNKNIMTLPFITAKSKALIFKNFMARMMGENKATYETEFVDKKGNLHIGRINATPLKEGDKIIGDLAIITDITKEKYREKELEAKILELEKINRVSIDRELKMIELKKKIEELEKK